MARKQPKDEQRVLLKRFVVTGKAAKTNERFRHVFPNQREADEDQARCLKRRCKEVRVEIEEVRS